MLIGGLVQAGEGVQMHAAGELGQGGGPVHALHELIHVQTAGQVQGSGKLPVDRVLHDDVHHGTAAVHHGVELVPCLPGRVRTGDAAQQAILCGDHIAPCGGGDLLTGGTQQGATPRDEAKMMTPEEVARIVARGIQKRKRLCLMENEGRATHFVKKFAPGFLDRMFYLVMSREPDSPLK